jgi:hypothetical protein
VNSLPVALASALSPTPCHRCLRTDAGQENQLTKSSPAKIKTYRSAWISFISILDIALLVLDITLLVLDVALLNKWA